MRLTTDKKVSEMGMVELARNSCYIGKDGAARYRDYSSDVDCREMIKKMMINFGLVESDYWDDVSNEVFDDEMMENLMYGINDMQGLIALFYRNMWAMAELREKLKYFEDLEEQKRLIKLPCKVGDTVWVIDRFEDDYDGYQFMANCGEYVIVATEYAHCTGDFKRQLLEMVDESYDNFGVDVEIFHKDNVFLTKEEAEQELKRLEKTNENNS